VSGPRPDPQHALALLKRYFLCRGDVLAFLTSWGKPCPTQEGSELEALLAAHVGGEAAPKARVRYRNRRGAGAEVNRFRVGSYTPALDGSTKWLCLDFDGGEHAEALADPKGTALAVHQAFTQAGLPAYLELSGGGRGWHLWCFFDPPAPARLARGLATALLPAEAALANGEVVSGRAGRVIEIFPKQTKIKPDGYGNLVWLPWWSEAEHPANQFHRVDDGGELVPYVPEVFDTVSAETVEPLVAAAREQAKEQRKQDKQRASERSWQEWRGRALAALPLESVYGPWLTGKRHANGWLECRDPESPSGDQNPSAGVADGTGEAERGQFHSFISGKTVSVFDFLIARGEAADFAAARRKVAELSGVEVPRPAGKGTRDRPTRPQIQVNNRQLRDIVAQAWAAIHASNDPPQLFLRRKSLARITWDGDLPTAEVVDEAAVFGLLAQVADWLRVTPDAVVNVSPSADASRVMLAYRDPHLPELEDIAFAPVFDQHGNLVCTPGYHPDAKLWYHRTESLPVNPPPSQPSRAQLDAAVDLLLNEPLGDFPFASDADRAHAVAALLLPLVRRRVDGPAPIHLVESPIPGSGKSLFSDLVGIIATGRSCEATTVSRDEDETRKKITALLAKGQPVIVLDNVRIGIDSSQLAAALTAETWTDRLLGQSRMLDLPNRATWLATSNNPRLSLEIARRCARIRLDPRTDRPWEREGFRHAPLREWAKSNRARLLEALLTLVQGWVAAGEPPGERALGSFEGWSSVIGGILGHAGIGGFLGNTEELYEAADVEGNEWREFVAAWWEEHRDRWISAKDLLELALARDMLGGVIGEKSLRSQQCRLGRALVAMRDRQFAEWRLLMHHDAHSKSAAYRLARVNSLGDPAGYRGMCRGISAPPYPAPICPEDAPGTGEDDAAGYRGISEVPPAGAHTGAHASAHARAYARAIPPGNPAISREQDPTAERASNHLASDPADPAGYGPSISREISRAYPAGPDDPPVDLAHLPEEGADE